MVGVVVLIKKGFLNIKLVEYQLPNKKSSNSDPLHLLSLFQDSNILWIVMSINLQPEMVKSRIVFNSQG